METNNIQKIKEEALVFDIETSSHYPDTGEEVDIRTNFDDYVRYAKVKWFGAYSYKTGFYVGDVVQGNEERIRELFDQHKIVVGFNSNEFDLPIMFNNGLLPEDYRPLDVDCMVILGSNTFYKKDGMSFKNRGALMGYKFKRNSLQVMAETMDLEVQKTDIDYQVFNKNSWTDEEKKDIQNYLYADVMTTKAMFDKLWDSWLPFTDFLCDKDIKNLSWIRSSIASLTYKAACNVLGVDDTYAENPDKSKEEMGGRVIEPKYEEARNVWYVDFTSLYPHMFCMFNLFAETEPFTGTNCWHGNDMFKVRGYYDISKQHPLCKDIQEKLARRIAIKKEIKETGKYNPEEYAIKIFLNSLYGAARSPVFEQIHTDNSGWDCCWLGQQINEYTEKRMSDFGFETIAGDTDSVFVIPKHQNLNEREFVKSCLQTIVSEILANVPFPADTYNIDIEDYIEYAMWPFSLQPIIDPATGKNKKEGNRLVKELKGKKKNYLYIANDKITMKGLPLKKDNATALGFTIYKEVIEPLILKKKQAKFSKDFVHGIIEDYLEEEENVLKLAREFKVKPAATYKNPSQIQAQISEKYFNGQSGVILLIKNKKFGRVGKSMKYCSVDEAKFNKLQPTDLDLSKLHNELEVFVHAQETN